ncbi:tripartite tricarboxylate transporter substrate-binding protein [Saxibacter everestensis]|uniref:Tripartite tricarboxylate transporter substrate-binding protein n=1 Tax=Saxibacter everestensis TaxID=2909229 RepID=A0ABY8QV90_9MICO|nr:tripartite tricarboxylate transporter substrate-binding protein [Brevibacteriaceae bacterium ZFBP1038]
MRSKTISQSVAAVVAAVGLTLTASGCTSGGSGGAGSNYPNEPINITAPSEPGSGWDTTARAMAQVLEEENLVDVPVPVQNQPGGIGCSWLTEMVNNHAGEANQLAISSLANQTVEERGLCDYGLKDVTLVASLFVENFVTVSPADSEINSVEALVGALKDDPAGVAIAAAGDDQLPFALFAEAAGIDPGELNFVTYEGGGEQTNALLNGDATVAIAGLSEFQGVLESGDLQAIMTFSEEPLEAPLDSVPTAIESGYDVTLGNWRGVYGPPDMPEEAVKFWQDTLAKMIKTEGWQAQVENNQWTELFQTGDELATYIDKAGQTVAEGVEKTDIGN